MISDEGRALITDFGLARVMGGGSGYTTSSVSGSYPWMAPELLMPSTSDGLIPSKASDVWALGCTVFEVSVQLSLSITDLSMYVVTFR